MQATLKFIIILPAYSLRAQVLNTIHSVSFMCILFFLEKLSIGSGTVRIYINSFLGLRSSGHLLFRPCNDNLCPSWTPWTPWTECSLTCGGGRRSRNRNCQLPGGQNPPPGLKLICPGKDQETEVCNPNKCPGLLTGVVAAAFSLL